MQFPLSPKPNEKGQDVAEHRSLTILLLKTMFLLLPVRKVELFLVLPSFFNDKELHLVLKACRPYFPAFSVQSSVLHSCSELPMLTYLPFCFSKKSNL